MKTIIHFSIEIDTMLRKALDGEKEILEDKNGNTLDYETTIIQLCKARAKGLRYLTIGNCDKHKKDGSCAGHKVIK